MSIDKNAVVITRRDFLSLTRNTALGVGALLAARSFIASLSAQAATVSEQHLQQTLLRISGSAENPTLTIVALAIRQAEYLAGLMSNKEI